MVYVVSVGAFIFLGVGLLYGVVGTLYSWSDHGKWARNSAPDPNATIVDRSVSEVEFLKNGKKIKRTLTFSDGFTYVTYKTRRKDGFFTYSIGLNENDTKEFLLKAIDKHYQQVEEKLGIPCKSSLYEDYLRGSISEEQRDTIYKILTGEESPLGHIREKWDESLEVLKGEEDEKIPSRRREGAWMCPECARDHTADEEECKCGYKMK